MSGSSGKIERSPSFLADENLETAIVQGVKRQRPDCVFFTADEAGIRNLPDDLVLRRAQELDLILVSHDRRTMYDHFATFLMSMGADQHTPGVFLVSQERFSLGQLIDFIVEIYDLSDHAEWRDRIVDLPLARQLALVPAIVYTGRRSDGRLRTSRGKSWCLAIGPLGSLGSK